MGALLNAGCFAAGTKLWTPAGYRNVEDLQEGDLVFSRDEHRPDGLIEAKPVETVFRRFTEVVHLHAGGRVIRTTGEHPFDAYNKGWTPAEELAAGDWVLTEAGDWKPVEEVYRTGELEVVYNLRVATDGFGYVGFTTRPGDHTGGEEDRLSDSFKIVPRSGGRPAP